MLPLLSVSSILTRWGDFITMVLCINLGAPRPPHIIKIHLLKDLVGHYTVLETYVIIYINIVGNIFESSIQICPVSFND